MTYSRLMYGYNCSFCNAEHWTVYQWGSMRCTTCNRDFMPDNSKSRTKWVKVDPKLTFREKIDNLTKKFEPEMVHIFPSFAVFKFSSLYDVWKVNEYMTENLEEFKDIDSDYFSTQLALIDLKSIDATKIAKGS